MLRRGCPWGKGRRQGPRGGAGSRITRGGGGGGAPVTRVRGHGTPMAALGGRLTATAGGCGRVMATTGHWSTHGGSGSGSTVTYAVLAAGRAFAGVTGPAPPIASLRIALAGSGIAAANRPLTLTLVASRWKCQSRDISTATSFRTTR